VVGAAGFTVPRDAARMPGMTRVDAVDVDPSVRAIAERSFLREDLSQKIRFLPLSGRFAVRKLRAEGQHYGFALLDAYFGQGIPDELVTLEFFRDVSRVAGRTAANVVMDRDLESNFARNLLATFREAFGEVWVIDARPGDSYFTNMVVTSWRAAGAVAWNGTGTVYRDDRNSADRDHVELIW